MTCTFYIFNALPHTKPIKPLENLSKLLCISGLYPFNFGSIPSFFQRTWFIRFMLIDSKKSESAQLDESIHSVCPTSIVPRSRNLQVSKLSQAHFCPSHTSENTRNGNGLRGPKRPQKHLHILSSAASSYYVTQVSMWSQNSLHGPTVTRETTLRAICFENSAKQSLLHWSKWLRTSL